MPRRKETARTRRKAPSAEEQLPENISDLRPLTPDQVSFLIEAGRTIEESAGYLGMEKAHFAQEYATAIAAAPHVIEAAVQEALARLAATGLTDGGIWALVNNHVSNEGDKDDDDRETFTFIFDDLDRGLVTRKAPQPKEALDEQLPDCDPIEPTPSTNEQT